MHDVNILVPSRTGVTQRSQVCALPHLRLHGSIEKNLDPQTTFSKGVAIAQTYGVISHFQACLWVHELVVFFRN